MFLANNLYAQSKQARTAINNRQSRLACGCKRSRYFSTGLDVTKAEFKGERTMNMRWPGPQPDKCSCCSKFAALDKLPYQLKSTGDQSLR